MTNLREAAQMAYAVPLHELLATVPRDARLVVEDADGKGTRFIPVGRYCHEAAEALRAALAQPEPKAQFEFQEYGPPNWGDSQVIKPEFVAEQKAMNEGLRNMVEPEPVAWMYDWYDETEDIDGVPIGGIVSDCISKDYDEAHSPTMGCHNIRPLYTAPPQREWQGLTNEERLVLWNGLECDLECMKPAQYAEAIEAKLKEKNNG